MKGDARRHRDFHSGKASSGDSPLWRAVAGVRNAGFGHSPTGSATYSGRVQWLLIGLFGATMTLLVVLGRFQHQRMVGSADLNLPPLSMKVSSLMLFRQIDDNMLEREQDKEEVMSAPELTVEADNLNLREKSDRRRDQRVEQERGGESQQLHSSAEDTKKTVSKTISKVESEKSPLQESTQESSATLLPDVNVAGRGEAPMSPGHQPVSSVSTSAFNEGHQHSVGEKGAVHLPKSQPLQSVYSEAFAPSASGQQGAPSRQSGSQSANDEKILEWIQFPYHETNETDILMRRIRKNGTLPCHNISTKSVKVFGLPEPTELHYNNDSSGSVSIIQLDADPVFELTIVSIGEDGQPRCAGGDYFETDLSGPRWKSRPPVLDLGDGTYSVKLQMDSRYASGIYTFSIILLYSNFHGLRHRSGAWVRMEEVASYEIEFVRPTDSLVNGFATTAGIEGSAAESNASSVPPSDMTTSLGSSLHLPMCKREDFRKKYWSGRWTRELETEDCEYSRYGRWLCVDKDSQCQRPWCEGKVGSLESNGWVYSAHCAFKIFTEKEAWQCLDGRWLFFWGDSNHMDTIRNLLNFVLGFEHKIGFLDRRMDTTFVHPRTNRSSVRITSMFNGHSNVTKNYEGLYSLHDPEYQAQLRSFFTGETAPDVMFMNSGVHDGIYWRDVESFFTVGMKFAIEFWTDVWSKMTAKRPDLFYRTTVSTGGNARNMSFNPQKMELFNHLMVDRFENMGLERFHIIDGFDYTYPWHFDHKTNDGVHYGRPPSKTRWAGNNIGHRYFVDLMLVHMLLNAVCPNT